MAIDGIGGYSSNSIANAVQPERKPVGNETATGTKFTSGKSAELVTSNQSEDRENENLENATKENSENHIKSVLSMTNEKIRMTNTRCEFEYHDKTNRVSIKVIDKETDEVVREIPPEETLEMVEKIWELAGLIMDERR